MRIKLCVVPCCPKPAKAGNYCWPHYTRKRNCLPLVVETPPDECRICLELGHDAVGHTFRECPRNTIRRPNG